MIRNRWPSARSWADKARVLGGDQGGYTLPLVIIMVMLAIAAVPTASFISSHFASLGTVEDDDRSTYALGAGIEAVMADMVRGADLVTTASTTLAYDGFETGDGTGGSGWSADWTFTGEASVRGTGSPHNGSFHLRLRSSDGRAERFLDISDVADPRIRFWAKAASFEPGEFASLEVSNNGIDWSTIKLWVDGDDDNDYRFYDIDVAGFSTSSTFYIAFDASMGDTSDRFFVDDVEPSRFASIVGYTPPTVDLNDVSPRVFVEDASGVAAFDTFETGDAFGGKGWLIDWELTGNSAVPATGQPHGGDRHLRLRSSDGWARLALDISLIVNPRLQFWAKADSFETGETASLLVSSNGTDYTTIKTWTQSDADDVYHYYDLDLSSYLASRTFYIAFDANMAESTDRLFVDDLRVTQSTLASSGSGSTLIAYDDWESDGFSGGGGWVDAWTTTTGATIVGTGQPRGRRHLRLQGSTDRTQRAVDLSNETSSPTLAFWAKARSFETGETASLEVSSNGSSWTTVRTWTTSDADNTYRFYSVDLSEYTLSSTFYIAFEAGMGDSTDKLFVDDIWRREARWPGMATTTSTPCAATRKRTSGGSASAPAGGRSSTTPPKTWTTAARWSCWTM